MTVLIIILCLVLLGVVVVQIGRISELANRIRGEEDAQRESNFWNSRLLLIFMILLLVLTVGSALYYKNFMLGYGPHESASAHGGRLDFMFDITLFFTGLVFVVTQIALFWFAFKYRDREGHSAIFMAHDNRLEILWTVIPAIVMTILVVYGLDAWNEVMTDVNQEEEVINIEATGMQFAWILRYPGSDGELGARDYKEISGINPLGQIWEDKRNLDDFQPNELVLPVDKKVRVRITSRDVIHNFYLPHFRVKMDAVPGMPTYFIFTPTKTTEDYRDELSKYPAYQEPADPAKPDGPMLWETFNYELACAELCGNGHYSMRRQVRIVTQEEYEEWKAKQSSYYMSTIRGSDNDPYKGEFLEMEQQKRKSELETKLDERSKGDTATLMIPLEYILVEDNKLVIDDNGERELDILTDVFNEYSDMTIVIHYDVLDENDRIQLKNALTERGIDPASIRTSGGKEEEGISFELKSL